MKRKLLSLVLAVALIAALLGAMTVTGFAAGYHNLYRTASGYTHFALAADDGSLYVRGGFIIPGTQVHQLEYTEFTDVGLDGVISVTCGWDTGAALTNEGIVYAWGFYQNDDDRHFGSYTVGVRGTPWQVPGLSDITEIFCTGNTYYAEDSSGTVWNFDPSDLKGIPTKANGSMPVRPAFSGTSPSASPVIDGDDSSALCADGSVWTKGGWRIYTLPETDGEGWWWDDLYIEALDGDWEVHPAVQQNPILMPDTNPQLATSIYANPHTMHLSGGQLYGAGHGADGQLGWGFFGSAASPEQAMNQSYRYLENVQKVSAGDRFTMALLEDGTVWASGYNEYGKLGDGTADNKDLFVQVQGLTGVTDIAAGKRHALALKEDGTVWAWGSSSNGQLGQGNRSMRMSPVQVKGVNGSGYLQNIKKIAAGSDVSMAITTNGKLYAWGNNYHGQLGDGTKLDRLSPVLLDLSNITDVAPAQDFTIALLGDGRVMSWGRNFYGCLGQYDSTDESGVPPGYVQRGYEEDLKNIVAVSAGADHASAVDKNGRLWSWGRNNAGQIGEGGTEPKNYARKAKSLDGTYELTTVKEVSCGKWYTIAELYDGTVVGFGSNERGQLGTGAAGGPNRLYPVLTEF